MQENNDKKQQAGAGSEDPPINNTKQNTQGGDTDKKDKIDVPEAAVENYKKAGLEGEE